MVSQEDPGSIPWSLEDPLGFGRSPGEGHGNPLQDTCLENSMDRGAWWATVHGLQGFTRVYKESDMTEQLTLS